MAADASITKDRITLETQSSYADDPPANHVSLLFDDITGSPLPMYMLPGDVTPRSFGEGQTVTLFEGVPTSGELSIATNTADALLCTHLCGSALLKSSVAANFDFMSFFFNADYTTTNYRRASNTVTEAGANSPGGGNNPTAALITGNTSPTNEYGMVRFYIEYFRNTSFVKKVIWQSSLYFTTGASFQTASGGLHWNNAAAITTFGIRTDNHSTDTLNAASRLHLVGVKI